MIKRFLHWKRKKKDQQWLPVQCIPENHLSELIKRAFHTNLYHCACRINNSVLRISTSVKHLQLSVPFSSISIIKISWKNGNHVNYIEKPHKLIYLDLPTITHWQKVETLALRSDVSLGGYDKIYLIFLFWMCVVGGILTLKNNKQSQVWKTKWRWLTVEYGCLSN